VFDDYVARLLDQVAIAKEELSQESVDAQELVRSGLFAGGVSWVGQPPRNPDEAAKAYVRLSASGAFPAEPRIVPGLNIQEYAEAVRPSRNALAHWLKEGRPAGPWLREVESLKGEPRISRLKVAAHIHLHHADPLTTILEGIKCNETRPDLLVTVSNPSAMEKTRSELRDSGLLFELSAVENRGRDIGHFLSLLSSELRNYDLVAHLHGKKSEHIGSSDFVRRWFSFLIGTLIGGPAPSLDCVSEKFENNPKLGLVFPEDPFICGWGANLPPAKQLAWRFGIHDLPSTPEFPVGNMFIVRPDALQQLVQLRLGLKDLPAEPIGRDGTILHALERLMPTICESSGYDWKTVLVPGLTR
jgi:hypothetical protein